MTRRCRTALLLTTACCCLIPGGGCASSNEKVALARPIAPTQANGRESMVASDWLGGMIFQPAQPGQPAIAEVPERE